MVDVFSRVEARMGRATTGHGNAHIHTSWEVIKSHKPSVPIITNASPWNNCGMCVCACARHNKQHPHTAYDKSTHTHTQTHTNTHKHTQAHNHAHAHTQTQLHTHKTHTHTNTHTQTHIRITHLSTSDSRVRSDVWRVEGVW